MIHHFLNITCYIFIVGHHSLTKFLKKSSRLDRFLFCIVLIGAIVASVSFFRGILMDRNVQVEYLSEGNLTNDEAILNIFVDIEGGVLHPGVYELPSGSRVKDVLVRAGGLSETADRFFVKRILI